MKVPLETTGSFDSGNLSMMEDNRVIGSGELWLPLKELYDIVSVVALSTELGEPGGGEHLISEVDRVLTRHAAEFLSLFSIKAPNPVDRSKLKKCCNEGGVYLKGFEGKRVIPFSLVNEALLLADMLDVNEFLALDLLTTAESEMDNYPSWPRGLIAVQMFFEGRFWLIDSLTTMIRLTRQARHMLHPSIQQMFRRTLNPIFPPCEDTMDLLIRRIEQYEVPKQMEVLETNLALGDWRHRRQIRQLLESIRGGFALVIFFSVTGEGTKELLGLEDVRRLLEYLKKQIAVTDKRQTLTRDDIILITTVLGAIYRNMNPMTAEMNTGFGQGLRKYLTDNRESFKCPELRDLFRLSLLVAERKLKPGSQQLPIDDDDQNLEFGNLFCFLHRQVFLPSENVTREEEKVAKVFHDLFTDFIVHMPLSLMEMKDCGDQIPNDEPSDYESFLECLGAFYRHDPFNLGDVFFLHNEHSQYLALSKLVRSCCMEETANSSNFCFLAGITSGNPEAMYERLRSNGHNASFDYFFETVLSLPEVGHNQICRYLHLVETLCSTYLPARIFFTNQKPHWIRRLMQLVKLQRIPKEIRASALNACAEMIAWRENEPQLSAEVVATMWSILYEVGLLDTLITDLEEVEVREESYSLTLGMLRLLKALISIRFRSIEFSHPDFYSMQPSLLDNEAICTVIRYIVDSVLLKAPFRTYRDPVQQWNILLCCVEIIGVLIDYVPKLMIQFLCDTPLMRTLLNTISECTLMSEVISSCDDSTEEKSLNTCSLVCLHLLWRVLQRQPCYLQKRHYENSQLFVGVPSLLMNLDAETGKSELILALLRFTDSLLPPENRLAAIEILTQLIDNRSDMDEYITTAVLQQKKHLPFASVVRHSLVEILTSPFPSAELQASTLKLLRRSVLHSDHSMGFFLLGIDSKKMDYCDHIFLQAVVDCAAEAASSSFSTLSTLLSSPRLATPTIRYLRRINFFQPFIREPDTVTRMSFDGLFYFLRCLAIELKFSEENGNEKSTSTTVVDLGTTHFSRLEEILAQIHFDSSHHSAEVELPELHFFDPNLILHALGECEFAHTELKTTKLIRIPVLESMLNDEISKLQKTSIALRGLRKTVHAEAKDILGYAHNLNSQREEEGRQLRAFEGWCQVVEVLMLCPHLPLMERFDLVGNVLRTMLLSKVVTTSVSNEFHHRAAEATLTGCAVLSSLLQGEEKKNTKFQQKTGSLLTFVITNLCDWIASASQTSLIQVRATLYAALLHCINLLSNDRSTSHACQRSFPLILETACRDCCLTNQGWMSSRMHALYLVGEMVRCCAASDRGFGGSNRILESVFNNGFLSTISDSLCVVDDLNLAAARRTFGEPKAMWAFFVFEAKMSMLIRLAGIGSRGVDHILDKLNLVKRLADMKVFRLLYLADHQQLGLSDSLYAQVFSLFHALLDSSSSGGKQLIATEQILHFLRAHHDSISKMLIIIEDRSKPRMRAPLLFASLMTRLAPLLRSPAAAYAQDFLAATSVKGSMFNLLHLHVEQDPSLGIPSIRLVKQAMLFLYYLSVDKSKGVVEEFVNLGVILRIVSSCAKCIATSPLSKTLTTTRNDELCDMVVILEVGLTLIRFLTDAFFKEEEQRPGTKMTVCQETLSEELIVEDLVTNVQEACKHLSNSDYTKTLLLKIRRQRAKMTSTSWFPTA